MSDADPIAAARALIAEAEEIAENCRRNGAITLSGSQAIMWNVVADHSERTANLLSEFIALADGWDKERKRLEAVEDAKNEK